MEEKLGVNKFNVDEENPHIVLKKEGKHPEYRKNLKSLLLPARPISMLSMTMTVIVLIMRAV